jgi:archaellum component FlaC
MNSPRLMTTRVSTLETNYKDLKEFVGNMVTNINTRISYLQSQIDSITVPDSTNDISNIKIQ